MANWKTQVEMSDLFRRHEEDVLSVQRIAAELAERVKKNRYSEYLVEQIEELESLGLDEDASIEDFDYVLQTLYDFGDVDHRIFFNSIDCGPDVPTEDNICHVSTGPNFIDCSNPVKPGYALCSEHRGAI